MEYFNAKLAVRDLFFLIFLFRRLCNDSYLSDDEKSRFRNMLCDITIGCLFPVDDSDHEEKEF